MAHKKLLLALCVASVIPAAARAQSSETASVREVHVAMDGSDLNRGNWRKPYRTIQHAVDGARPGRTILVHAGTYREVIQVKNSGQPGLPIVLKSAGDGPVVVAPRLPAVSCTATAPTRARAIRIAGGLGYWRITGLTVVGGILVSGQAPTDLQPYVRDRSLPGRREYDPKAAAGTLKSLGAFPADSVQITRNRLVGRGIYASMARYGTVEENEILDVECGTGGGVWIGRFSDGWTVRGNTLRGMEGSKLHYMSEGIRFSGSSMYNLVERNVVQDITGIGRGITTDANSGWNVIRRNTVRRAHKGFSEQRGGWGNQWLDNLAEENRQAGYSVDVSSSGSPVPDDDVPAYLEFRCNRARGNGMDLVIGGVQASRFDSNGFGSVHLFSNVRAYWGAARNVWEGSRTPPPASPVPQSCS